MWKRAKSSVPSDSEDSNFSSSEEDDDETVEVNGFQILVSEENQVREMFKEHLDLTSNFNLKTKKLKNAYMDVLLDLIATLSKSIEELTLKELNKAYITLYDLTREGLKVDWLSQKLDEAYLKEKQRASGARIKELEEQVKKRKLTLSYLESDLKKEKAAALAAKARTGISDVVRIKKS